MAPLIGSSVPIYCGSEAYTDNLRKLLDCDGIRDLPLVTLAIAGEYRTGKSFLLSYIIRYLQSQDLGDEDEPLIGFDHKSSVDAVTQGINIWDHPFIVDIPTNYGVKKVVVLLLDCQGLFDSNENMEGEKINESQRIFALSTLISSIQIFNVMFNLNESILSHLELFTEIASGATTKAENETPFQKIMILIRDWSKPAEFPWGSNGGKQFLLKKFKDKSNSLHRQYKDIDCFLMPRPGDKCAEDPDYNGCLKELRKDFKAHLKDLMEYLLTPLHLETKLKMIAGKTTTAGHFCDFFEICTKTLNKVNWDQPFNGLQVWAKVNSDTARCEALVQYQKDIMASVETQEKLQFILKNAILDAIKVYEEKSHFSCKNDEPFYKEGKQNLIKDMKEKCQLPILRLKHKVEQNQELYDAEDDYLRANKVVLEEMKTMIEQIKKHQMGVRLSKCAATALGVASIPFYFIPPLIPVGIGLGAGAAVTGAGASFGDLIRNRIYSKEVNDKLLDLKRSLDVLKKLLKRAALTIPTETNDTGKAVVSLTRGATGFLALVAPLVDDVVNIAGGVTSATAAAVGRIVGGAFAGVGAGIGIIDVIYSWATTNPSLETASEVVGKIETEIESLEEMKKELEPLLGYCEEDILAVFDDYDEQNISDESKCAHTASLLTLMVF